MPEKYPPFDTTGLESIAKSKSTSVDKIKTTESENSKHFVVKIKGPNAQRMDDETDQDYYDRRLEQATERIKNQREKENLVHKVTEEVAPLVFVPKQHWFVFNDDEGFPIAANVQEEVVGKTLRSVGLRNLNTKQLTALGQLLEADNKLYSETDNHLDLLGSEKGDTKVQKIKTLVLGALETSPNILIADDGRVALVDTETAYNTDLMNKVKQLRYKLDAVQLRSLMSNLSTSRPIDLENLTKEKAF